MPNKPDTILPAARHVARVVLTSLSYHKRITPGDLRQRGDWLHGAQLLATALGDQAAVDLLQAIGTRLTAIAAAVGDQASADLLLSVDTALRDLAINHRDTEDTLVGIAALMERVMDQGQEARP